MFVGCGKQLPAQDAIYIAHAIEAEEENIIEERRADISNAPEEELQEAMPPVNITPETSKPTVQPIIQTPEAPRTETITLSVSCSTILNNIEKFNSKKNDLIPQGGAVIDATSLEFCENFSVFDYLEQLAYEQGIVLKYKSFPSIYVEAIGDIAEFDCGGGSGWQYKVNGMIPSVSMSAYKLKGGDKVEILYTCDFGNDL